MTAGHGGEHGGAPERTGGGPEQRPGYAPAPPPPPPTYSPYPQQGPGQVPGQGPGFGPGYGPGQGYGPAPSAPGGWGAPKPVEQPATVRFGLGAIIAALVLGAINLGYQGLNFQSIVDQATAGLTDQQAQAVQQLGPDFERTLLIVTMAIGAVWLCLQALFIWFAWRGRNWARVVLWVISGLAVASGLVGFSANSTVSGFSQGLSICAWVLTVAAIVLLALRPSNEWYRYRKWQRSVGQG